MRNPKRYWFVGLRFMSYGGKYESSKLRLGTQHDGNGGFDQNLPPLESITSVKFKHTYNYFEIPIGIRQYLTSGKSRLFLQAAVGPSYFLTGRNVTTYKYNTGSSQTSFNPDNFNNFRLVNFMA